MIWLLADIAFFGAGLGIILARYNAAMVVCLYMLASIVSHRWLGMDITPEWFNLADIFAACVILTVCSWQKRWVAVAGLYLACIPFYGTAVATEATLAISIVQFMLCWPVFASEWTPSIKKLFRTLRLRDRGLATARVTK